MARQKLGQHFLARRSILDRIARAACPSRESLVIEIGPGRGALTAALLEHADRVIAVEIDPVLAARLREQFPEERLTVLEADVLETDLAQWGPAVVAGNLPYYISSPIVSGVLRLGSQLQRAVLLVQKEVAERLAARPGSRDYGFLSVQTQLFSRAEVLFGVAPGAFSPPPKVDSAVVRLTPLDPAAAWGVRDTAAFLEFAGHAFRQKRKTLRNNLAPAYGKDRVDQWPEGSLRAEQIAIPQLVELFHRLRPE